MSLYTAFESWLEILDHFHAFYISRSAWEWSQCRKWKYILIESLKKLYWLAKGHNCHYVMFLVTSQFLQDPVLHSEVIVIHENICVWQHEAFVSENVYNQLLLGFRKKDTMLGNQWSWCSYKRALQSFSLMHQQPTQTMFLFFLINEKVTQLILWSSPPPALRAVCSLGTWK